jgi:HEAT repeat protein
MMKYSAGFCAAIIVVAGTVVLSSNSSWLPVSAATPAKSGAQNKPSKALSKPINPVNPINPISVSKTDQAKAILNEIQNLDHPEQRVATGSPGWQEERRAATESNQHKLHESQAKLSSLGSTIAPVLAEGLNNPNRDVTQICTTVLVQFGADSVNAVVAVIKKYGEIPNAVAVLKQIGSDSLPPLLEMLKSSDGSESMTALTVIDSVAASGNNFRLSHHRRMPAITFVNMGGGAETVVFSGAAIEQICNLKTNDRSIKFRQLLADLLGKIGPRSPRVAARLSEFIANEEQPEVREAAISGLGNIVALQNQETANESADIILKSLTKDDYPGCRVEAANALGRIPAVADKSVPILAQSLKDGYPEVALASVQALSALGTKASGALPDLVKFAQDSPDINSQYQAMAAIGNMKEAALPALPFILKCLGGSNAQLRTGALNVVANIGPPASSAVPVLIPMLSDSQVRMTVVRALGAIGPKASAAVPALRELTQSNQPDRFNERRQVQQALQSITGEAQDMSGSPGNVTRSFIPRPTIRIQSRNATSI